MRLTFLNPQKALIFRITHIDNVPWILDNGLHCRSSSVRDSDFREIGNPDLIEKRSRRVVHVAPGGTLDERGSFMPADLALFDRPFPLGTAPLS